jgi:hypothetical protein
MDLEKEWAQVWARFNSLRMHPPSRWSADEVMQYHNILTALEQASGEDLSVFRITDSEVATEDRFDDQDGTAQPPARHDDQRTLLQRSAHAPADGRCGHVF